MPMTAEIYRQKYHADPVFRANEQARARVRAQRNRALGVPRAPSRYVPSTRVPVTVDERFWAKVKKTDTCWLWIACISPKGYGQFGKSLAHRFSYELHKGPIPPELQIDHLCRVRHCVNPAHLEAVGGRENLLRGKTRAAENAAKTTCPNGHPYTTTRSYVQKKNGRPYTMRICTACQNQAAARRYRLSRPAGSVDGKENRRWEKSQVLLQVQTR